MTIPTEKNTSVKVTEKLSNIETLKWKLKECRGESLNNSGSDKSPGTNKERVGELYITDPGKHHNT